jgi:hypothetical protein
MTHTDAMEPKTQLPIVSDEIRLTVACKVIQTVAHFVTTCTILTHGSLRLCVQLVQQGKETIVIMIVPVDSINLMPSE